MTHYLRRNVHRFTPNAEEVRDDPEVMRIVEDVSHLIWFCLLKTSFDKRHSYNFPRIHMLRYLQVKSPSRFHHSNEFWNIPLSPFRLLWYRTLVLESCRCGREGCARSNRKHTVEIAHRCNLGICPQVQTFWIISILHIAYCLQVQTFSPWYFSTAPICNWKVFRSMRTLAPFNSCSSFQVLFFLSFQVLFFLSFQVLFF